MESPGRWQRYSPDGGESLIALYLLAAHLTGDFVLQTRWQAVGKFGDSDKAVALRARHVTTYCLPFVPIAIIYSNDRWEAAGFMMALYWLHFFTDRQRFTSTLGDWIAWQTMNPKQRHLEWGKRDVRDIPLDMTQIPPNPWPPMPILIDQTLHVVQVAVLAGLLLT